MRNYWGPLYWYFFHSLIGTYPDIPSEMQKKLYYNIFLLFIQLIPCKSCQGHFITLVKAYPPNMNSRIEWEKWGVKIHNKVNLRLKKPKIRFNEHQTTFIYNNHLNMYQFITYVEKQAYLNNIPFDKFINLLNMLIVIHPCEICRSSLRIKYIKDNLPQIMVSKINLSKWLKSHIKPKGFHIKEIKQKKLKKKKKKKNKTTHINVNIIETENTPIEIENKIITTENIPIKIDNSIETISIEIENISVKKI